MFPFLNLPFLPASPKAKAGLGVQSLRPSVAEKCAAVQYRRAQHVKEPIYFNGIKEGLWNESDEMFLKVSMKIDSICKNAH